MKTKKILFVIPLLCVVALSAILFPLLFSATAPTAASAEELWVDPTPGKNYKKETCSLNSSTTEDCMIYLNSAKSISKTNDVLLPYCTIDNWVGDPIYTNSAGTSVTFAQEIGYLYGTYYSSYPSSVTIEDYTFTFSFSVSVRASFAVSNGVYSLARYGLCLMYSESYGKSAVYWFIDSRLPTLLSEEYDYRVINGRQSFGNANTSEFNLDISVSDYGDWFGYVLNSVRPGTGSTLQDIYLVHGYCPTIAEVPQNYRSYGDFFNGWGTGAPQIEKVNTVRTLLDDYIRFGTTTKVLTDTTSSDSYYQLGYNNGRLDAKEDNEKALQDKYLSGYHDALDNLKTEITQKYNDGFVAGKTAGYSSGYSAGVANAQNYSFLGLIGAVIDAPVQAFMGLLDFEILGVNMSAFVLSLLSLSFLIIVIKVCLGGK